MSKDLHSMVDLARPRTSFGARSGAAIVAALLVALLIPTTAVDALPGGPAATATMPAGTTVRVGTACVVDPRGLATGPDGAVWFTSGTGDSVSRVSPAGEVVTFRDPRIDDPRGIALGADGALWFGIGATRSVGRITTTGAVTTYTSAEMDGAFEVAAGPDGAVWFTGGKTVGRITTSGAITVFTHPEMSDYPTDLAVGPDGALWFANFQDRSIGRITTAGAFTFHRQAAIGAPEHLTAGADGALWFTTRNGADSVTRTIGRITVGGTVTTFTDPAIGVLGDITAGPDGALWFTDWTTESSSIGRITTAGTFSSFTGTGLSEPSAIVSGPGGDLWFTNRGTASIGRMSTAGALVSFSGDCVRDPLELAPGPAGTMWFTGWSSPYSSYRGASIGRVGPTGEVSELVSPLLDRPSSIVEGSDGAMWFANSRSIGRVGPDGAVSLPSGGTDVGWVTDLAAGPDGALWFTDSEMNRIGRITPAGVVSTFSGPAVNGPTSLVLGPDGALWFTNIGNDSIGRITTAGALSTVAAGGVINGPRDTTLGSDGAIWFTNGGTRRIGKVTVAGAVTGFAVPGGGGVTDLAAGPDGHIWFVGAGPSSDLEVQRVSTSGSFSTVEGIDVTLPGAIAAGPAGTVWVVDQLARGTTRSLVRVDALGAPGPPTQVVAVPGKGQATVTWEPGLDGTTPISSYTVIASPGGQSCVRPAAQARTCTFVGLTPGVAHTFAVTATNGQGAGAPAPSAPVVPWSGSAYHTVVPTRLLDSRTANGGWNAKLVAGAPRNLDVTGRAGIPASATAAVLNVTITDASVQSFLTAYPSGSSTPTSSSLNFLPGDTRANLVTVAIGSGGRVTLANAVGSVHVVVDVVGYYDDGVGPGLLFDGINPTRVLDTRVPSSYHHQPLVAGAPFEVPVVPLAGLPVDASAVVINVTSTGSTNDTFVTAWDPDDPTPTTSNLNVRAGDIVANLMVVGTGDGSGTVAFANAVGSTELVVDLVGYFGEDDGDRFHALAPTRVLDDRNGTGLAGPWGPRVTRLLPLTGTNGIPADASGVVSNITATGSTAQSYVAAFSPDRPQPISSTVNFVAGQTIANASYLGFVDTGSVALFNAEGSVHIVADVSGYFARY